MELTTIELLKVLANRFYLNIDTNPDVRQYEDWEYDQLAEAWEKENEGHSVKELVDWDDEYKIERETTVEPLAKEKYMPDEILSAITEEYKGKKFHVNYKYDGCSVEAIYSTSGKLKQILGTPDEKFGIVRTEKLFDFFPKEVKKGIHKLQGEVLVSTDKYGHLARNQANGACNSKYLQDKIDKECFVRCYNIEYYDNVYNYDRLINDLQDLPVILGWRNDHYEVVFCQAEELKPSDITGEPFIEESIFIDRPDYISPDKVVHDVATENFLIDGYVVYSEEGRFAYKMYYTEYKDVKIKDIDWAYNWSNGSYVPTAVYDAITLNDKTNTRVALGGVSKMVEEGRGIGAIVRVVMSGGTIPKIIKVLEPSENFNWPICECGEQLGLKDQVGAVLKCHNDNCILKVSVVKDEIAGILGWTVKEVVNEEGITINKSYVSNGTTLFSKLEDDMFFPLRLLHIDRWKPEKKFKQVSVIERNCRMVDSINNGATPESIISSLSGDGEILETLRKLLEEYRDVHSDESFDAAVLYMNENFGSDEEADNFVESYKAEMTEFLKSPSVDKMNQILNKYFSLSALQYKNAGLNIKSVVNSLPTFL